MYAWLLTIDLVNQHIIRVFDSEIPGGPQAGANSLLNDTQDDAHEVVLGLLELADEDRPSPEVVGGGSHEVVQSLHLLNHCYIAVVEHSQGASVRWLLESEGEEIETYNKSVL